MKRLLFWTASLTIMLLGVPNAFAQDTFTLTVGDCVSEGRIFPNGTAGGCDAALPNTPTAGAGSIEAAGGIDTYAFAANAGDFVFVEPRLYAGNGQPVNWRVVAPSGAVLFNGQLQPQRGSAPPRFDLTETGTYQIIVGEGSAYVGVYQFALWDVPPITFPALTLETEISGQFTAPGQQEAYFFNATAGDLLFFESRGACCTGFADSLVWTLIDLSGTPLFQRFMNGGDPEVDSEGFFITDPSGSEIATIPADGTYLLLIGNIDNPFTGTYRFEVFPVQSDTLILFPPTVVTPDYPDPGAGRLSTNNLLDEYLFLGTAGETLTFWSDGVFGEAAGPPDVFRWLLDAPSGANIFDQSLAISRETTVTLPEDGIYRLFIGTTSRANLRYNIRVGAGNETLPAKSFVIDPSEIDIFVDVDQGILQDTNGAGTFLIIDDPDAGDLFTFGDGAFFYEPFPEFYTDFGGFDTFVYLIFRPDGSSATGVINVFARGNVRNDSYLLDGAGPLTVAANEGVLANDQGVTAAELVEGPRFGTLNFNADGSFTYTPNLGFTGLDTFTYRELNGPPAQATVEINVNSIVVRVPGPQFTPVDTPLNVPDVSVDTNSDVVTLDLSVSNGTLNITGADGGFTGQNFGGDPPPVVTGNGSGNVRVTGTRDAINAVLTSLTYTPNQGFQGVDELVVVGTVTGGSDTKTVIITVGEDGEVTREIRSGPIDTSRDFLLRVISEQPGTIIRGTVPDGAVPGGDVYVRILASGEEIRVPVAELGDATLIELGIQNSAEVFGLSAGGATVPEFTQSVEVCLRGSGGFYYRDATSMPRSTQQLTTRDDGGFTCASIPNSGTVILVGGGLRLEQATAIPLTGCMVTTRNIVNLREAPSLTAPIIRPLPFNVTLTALEREGNWFYVDFLGLFGWASGDFLTLEGTCG